MHQAISQLVASHLQPFHDHKKSLDFEVSVATFQQAQPFSGEVVASCGVGLDHFAGEQVLAAALLRETPRGYEHRLLWAVTQQRTLIGGWSSTKGGYNDRRISLPHPELVRVESKKGLFDRCVKLYSPRGEEDLGFESGSRILAPFYEALIQLPAQQRTAPPLPFPQASAEDPAGAQAASQGFGCEDPPALALLVRLDEAVRAGQIESSVGYDLSCRILLAHRSMLGGPGIAHGPGTWLSPLSPDDLGHVLVGILGAPMHHNVDGEGWTWLSFPFDAKHTGLNKAVAAVGIASFLGLGVGLSPGKMIAHKMLEREPLTMIHVGFRASSSSTAYMIRGPQGSLEYTDAMVAHQLHQALIHATPSVLERRCALGWVPSYPELWS